MGRSKTGAAAFLRQAEQSQPLEPPLSEVKQSFRDPLAMRVINKFTTLVRATPLGLATYRQMTRQEPQFECPACGFQGAFVTLHAVYGDRKYAQCPKCGALERHRLMALVMKDVEKSYSFSGKDILHFAPEPFFAPALKARARSYRCSDLVMRNMDMRANLTDLPIESASVDVLLASFILQYIADDMRALREIRRVLRPGGLAVLPVTVVSDTTVEYPEPNMHESGGHVRAPGPDYFDRMAEVFSKVDVYTSKDYPESNQTYVFEDRAKWPTSDMPLRRSMLGEKHLEYVPICWR